MDEHVLPNEKSFVDDHLDYEHYEKCFIGSYSHFARTSEKRFKLRLQRIFHMPRFTRLPRGHGSETALPGWAQ